LQIGKFYYPVNGGMEEHLYHLCDNLKDRYDLQVVVANTTIETKIENVKDVKIIRAANIGEVFSNSICPTMPLWLKKFSPDIVHIHLPNPMAHFSYLLAKPGGKLVVMWHSDIIKQKILLKLYKPFLLNLLKKAEGIIATSPVYIEHSPFLSKFKEKCKVIPLGIDLARFAFNEKIKEKVNELRNKYSNRIILCVGRLTYYKGLEHLIKAMKDIEANLLIIGEGTLGKRLRNFTLNSPGKNKIWFLGRVSHENIIPYFHACNVFVLPSVERSEAFGIVQLEAMACCKPVVSTDLKTGVPWVNQNGVTGIVVSHRNPKALSEAINTLLTDHKLSKEYGENGRKRVEKEFTTELVAERTMSLYQEIL